MKEQILEMVKRIQPYEEIDGETLLMDDGILDSLGLAELIVSLEEAFQVNIPEELIREENFQTIGSIEEMIKALG